MPESKSRKKADTKKKSTRKAEAEKQTKQSQRLVSTRGWVAPAFITVGLLGVLWLVLYYIASPYIPFMAQLGNWNLAIGIGLMAAAFAIATQWK